MKFEICRVDEIPESGSKIIPFFGREVHVYKVDGKPRAVANVCMHFGGPLECRDGKFVCAWHKAEYSMEDGKRLAAPAPRSLVACPSDTTRRSRMPVRSTIH